MSARPVPASRFARHVLATVAGSRPGEVLTYGEVAAELGSPRAARAVGRVLREHGATVPWWRVVTATGRLVPGNEREQRTLLEREGVTCDDARVLHGPTARFPSGERASGGGGKR